MLEFEYNGLTAGVWSGILRADQPPARVYALLNGQTVASGRLVSRGQGEWQVQIGLPVEALADGAHSFLLMADQGQAGQPPQPDAVKLAVLSVLAGDVLADDLRAEISLLRSEIDLLKRELRRLAQQE